jgi:LysM repeat protein
MAPDGGWVEPLDFEEGPEYEAPGLATLLGLDRRPRVGATRPVLQPERRSAEPAWERPHRYEAYPSLRTRVGMPVPSRLVLSAGALVLAALALFFIPPLFIQQGAGTVVPDETRSPSTAASTPPASIAPTPAPTPKGRTYTVKPGDVLSTIAKRFGVTVEQIIAANKQIKDPNKIKIGDVIAIPSAAPSEILDGTVSSSP